MNDLRITNITIDLNYHKTKSLSRTKIWLKIFRCCRRNNNMLFYLRNAEIFAELNEIIIYIPMIVTSRKNTKRKKKKYISKALEATWPVKHH